MVPTILKIVLSNFWRYCFCSLAYNFAAFLFWMVVPLCAKELDASNWDLAVINAVNFFSRFTFSWGGGPLNNLVPGSILARLGALVYVIACVILIFFHDKLWYLWTMGVMYGLSYALFWIPIQTSISRESNAGNAEFWLGLFSSSWTSGQALGYLAGAFLFSLLGTEEAISISICSLSLIFIFYPCWETKRVCGIDMSLDSKKEKSGESLALNDNEVSDEGIDIDGDKEIENIEDPNTVNNPKSILWNMGKYERKRLRIRTMRFIVPSFVCCITCYGNLLTYGSQYFNRIDGTKDGFFPFMAESEDRYDIFIGVFFFTIYMMYAVGMITFAKLKFLFFNRAIAYYFMVISIIMHFICGTVSNWITQMVCAVILGLCGAYSFQNLLVTTSRLSMLTSNVSSIYVGLQESLTYNLIAFALPLIAGPISDAAGDYRIPIFGCAVVGVLLLVLSELSIIFYDFVIMRKMDKRDVHQVGLLVNEILEQERVDELLSDDEFLKLCRQQMLTPKQVEVLHRKLFEIRKSRTQE
ncbi:Major facilitator superfamily (MFS) profile domain-containing protein [Entamoeba marina]